MPLLYVHDLCEASFATVDNSHVLPVVSASCILEPNKNATRDAMMSVEKLPTEIDNVIVSFLRHDPNHAQARASLNALSKVSKYHRKIAEPSLYKHLCFELEDRSRVKRIMLTLLSRRDLAQHIRSLRLRSPSMNQYGTTSMPLPLTRDVNQRTKSKLREIHGVITKAFPSTSESVKTLREEWINTIVNPRLAFDGRIALIMALAQSLKAVELFDAEPRLVRRILRTVTHYQQRNSETSLFQLEEVRIIDVPFWNESDIEEGYDDKDRDEGLSIPILPRMRILSLERIVISSIQLNKLIGVSMLHTLELRDVDMEQDTLNDAFRSMRLQNVHTLVMSNIDSWGDASRYRTLAAAIEENLPQLEYLEWIRDPGEPADVVWVADILSLMRKIHTLRIDARLLFGFVDTRWDLAKIKLFFDPFGRLPANLETLHIVWSPFRKIRSMLSDPLRSDVEASFKAARDLTGAVGHELAGLGISASIS